MSLRVGMVLALSAGLTATAWGQAEDIRGIPVHVQDASAGTYGQRAAGMPVDNWTNANRTGLFRFLAETNGKHILDDFNFAPGPWAAQASRTIDAVDFSVWSNLGQDFRLRMTIWDVADVDFAGFGSPGGSMINPSATALRVEEFPAGGGFYNYAGEGFVQINNSLPSGPLALSGSIAGIVVEVVAIDGAGVPQPTAGPGATFFSNNSARGAVDNTPANSVNPAAPGFSLPDYGRDADNDGTFIGDAAADATGERRSLIVADLGGATPFATYAYSFAVRGDIVVAGTPSCESFSTGADNVWVSDSEALGANSVKWYCVTLASSANDANYKYIDFDTNGSTTDVAVAVFDSNGIMVANDDENGGAGNALLTFGMGRRASEGGADYDGINYFPTQRGQSPGTDGLLAGTYYVAVASASGGAVFADGFFASGSGPAGTSVLRARTNIGGGAINPSAAPAATRIVGGAFEDPIVAPGGQTAGEALYSPGVFWYDVQLCRDADAGNPVQFMVISPPAGEPPGKRLYVFDALGNLRGTAQGGRPSSPTVNFGGSDPFLPAGTYYICTTFDYSGSDTDIAPNSASDGRWHVRPRVNDGGYTLQILVLVPWGDCPAGVPCELADTNCDGSLNGFDVEATEQAVNGDFSNFCLPSADLNNDGAENGFDVEYSEFLTLNC
ncbi:hypothetical protein PHYC_03165 [Phycisphaerales bacterium]|nr:hypothetical protein PHYC_03165 [Phycisphaerales bacterium]